MVHELAAGVIDWVRGCPPLTAVAILSAVPVTELRGSIPYGILVEQLRVWEVVPVAVATAFLPGIPVFLGFHWVTDKLADKPLLGRFVQRFLQRAKHKSERVGKLGMIGLIIFVAIPLPGSGIYTGAAVAAVLALTFWRAMACLLIGAALSGTVVAALTLGGVGIFSAVTRPY